MNRPPLFVITAALLLPLTLVYAGEDRKKAPGKPAEKNTELTPNAKPTVAKEETKPKSTNASVTVGTRYDITTSVELRAGPGIEHEKKINQKASEILKTKEYLSVDSSTTVQALQLKDDWVEVQVVEPAHLSESHRGWIPLKNIKLGAATQKKSGWIRTACLVYPSKDTNGEPVGSLNVPAAVGVADDGSGWLKLIHGPIKDPKGKEFLDWAVFKKPLYIQQKHFSEQPPSKWDSLPKLD